MFALPEEARAGVIGSVDLVASVLSGYLEIFSVDGGDSAYFRRYAARVAVERRWISVLPTRIRRSWTVGSFRVVVGGRIGKPYSCEGFVIL